MLFVGTSIIHPSTEGVFLLCNILDLLIYSYKHVKGQSYDFVVMDNEKKISISEDRRKMISEQYCSMEDTFYVGE